MPDRNSEPDNDPIRIARSWPSSRSSRSNSIRAAGRALSSPRVWAILAAASGWAFGAATYVAGSARQSDVSALLTRTKALEDASAAHAEQAADASTQSALSAQSAVLAYQALVGGCAQRAARAHAEQDRSAAEARYSRAVSEGESSAAAIRKGLLP